MKDRLKTAVFFATFSLFFFAFSFSVSAADSSCLNNNTRQLFSGSYCGSCNISHPYCIMESEYGFYCFEPLPQNTPCLGDGICGPDAVCILPTPVPTPPPPVSPPSGPIIDTGCTDTRYMGPCGCENCNSTYPSCLSVSEFMSCCYKLFPAGTLCVKNISTGVCNINGTCVISSAPTPTPVPTFTPGPTSTPRPPAPTAVPTPTPQAGFILFSNPLRSNDLRGLLNAIINYIFWIGIALVPLIFLVACFLYVTSGGSPQRAETAKKIMLYAVIGLVILLVGRGVVTVVESIITKP